MKKYVQTSWQILFRKEGSEEWLPFGRPRNNLDLVKRIWESSRMAGKLSKLPCRLMKRTAEWEVIDEANVSKD